MQPFGDERDWFVQKHFGLFVHWGPYAVDGWHEQAQQRRHISRGEYEKLAGRFNPTAYDPEAWLDMAEQAGMEYLCFTTKHHDGFCMWDSALTDYKITNTPYGRDVLAMLAQACRRRSMPLCQYYSVADWHHPNYPNQGRHHELPPQPGDTPDLAAYVAYLRAQVEELCSNYGRIAGIWWDMNVPEHRDESIHEMIRRLQPAAVINDRGFGAGDFSTPEREAADALFAPFEKRIEACQSVGQQSWGYRIGEDYYADRALIRAIDGYLARGGNYLLNVGPMADGTIAPQARAIVQRVGRWYKSVREAFDAEPAPDLIDERRFPVTRRGNTLYIHMSDLETCGLPLRPLTRLPKSATLLNTGQPVETAVELLPWYHREGKAYLHLRNLPANELAGEVGIVRLEFDDYP